MKVVFLADQEHIRLVWEDLLQLHAVSVYQGISRIMLVLNPVIHVSRVLWVQSQHRMGPLALRVKTRPFVI